MGYDKIRRPVAAGGLGSFVVAGTTATGIPNRGVCTIAPATANRTYQLAKPLKHEQVTILVNTASTGVATIRTNSSAVTFYGTTFDAFTCTTGQGALGITLTAIASTKWALTSIGTKSTAAAIAFVASTR